MSVYQLDLDTGFHLYLAISIFESMSFNIPDLNPLLRHYLSK